MGMNLTVKSRQFALSENQEWLGSRHGTQEADSITLDRALCVAAFPTGFVPSGIPLGKVTATGRYAPALSAAVDGSQVVDGHLFTSVDFNHPDVARVDLTTAPNSPAALLWHGEVVLAKMPALAGQVALATPANQPKMIRYV